MMKIDTRLMFYFTLVIPLKTGATTHQADLVTFDNDAMFIPMSGLRHTSARERPGAGAVRLHHGAGEGESPRDERVRVQALQRVWLRLDLVRTAMAALCAGPVLLL